MNAFKTKEVADIIGVHPNTVRLYEKLELIPIANRQANGYRVFTDFHIEQFKLARMAFEIEIIQNGLRKKIINIVKLSASKNFDKAIELTNEYIDQINIELKNAKEAVSIVESILSKKKQEKLEPEDKVALGRKQVSNYLNISMDSLRNWEMNGLLSIKRKENGYRVYTRKDIEKLKIISSLRCANYSLESILRLLNKISVNPGTDIEITLNIPKEDEDIITVCDRLMISLNTAKKNAKKKCLKN
ncbi:MerR family transcriptional regulator [Peptostreptococcus faecalis]|uniref:MerR family transcriptional regulator n=1 Tax=Peptostreptococcus faecalis TaxID=2045015 RepID=UPI000C7D38C7|nr:MerR family transcriptional regulator [Peptostreptococcus faecalis]